MSLMIYNTLTHDKKPFKTIEAGKVRLYVCGPTVYDQAHVGHAMSSLVFDVIRRYLEYRGYQVRHVMNYTDIDDKVIQRAAKLGVDPLMLAEQYINEYRQHIEALNILPAAAYPRVSQQIENIIAMVQGLERAGFAYAIDGDVYFRVARDSGYGKLSGRKPEDMQAGSRLEVDERKENAADFALWKSAKPGEPSWDSPWGKGRPGWHIECSAMCLNLLGEQIDIHGGGNDLIFPHHENELAQTECLTGKPMARYWVHNGMLQLKGEKMSKSLGNLVTIAQFLDEHEAETLRLLVLNSHYRSPLTFNDDVIRQAEGGLERLRGGLRPAQPGQLAPQAEAELKAKVAAVQDGFEEAMDDDFNSPAALGQLFELVRAINHGRDAGLAQAALDPAQQLLRKLAGLLGLDLDKRPALGQQAQPFIELLAEIRNELRQVSQWTLADRIRDRLAELGIVLEDGKGGTTWHRR
jgi:cysteinyl-tRNA synthetase